MTAFNEAFCLERKWIPLHEVGGCPCPGCIHARSTKLPGPKTGGGFDTEGKDLVLCPHCGGENSFEAYEIFPEGQDDEESLEECEHCEKQYIAQQHVKHTYSTRPA